MAFSIAVGLDAIGVRDERFEVRLEMQQDHLGVDSSPRA
jgi:hypothetical protein